MEEFPRKLEIFDGDWMDTIVLLIQEEISDFLQDVSETLKLFNSLNFKASSFAKLTNLSVL